MKKLLIIFCMTVAVGLSYAIPPDWTTHKFTVKDKTVSISMPDTALAGCFFDPSSRIINMAFLMKNVQIMTEIIIPGYRGPASEIKSGDSITSDSVIISNRHSHLQFYKKIQDRVWLNGASLFEERDLLDSIFKTITIEDTTNNNYPMIQYRPFKVKIIKNDSVTGFGIIPKYDDRLVRRSIYY